MRWKRHWPLVVTLIAVPVLLVLVFGDMRMSRLTSTNRTRAESTGFLSNVEGTTDVFEASIMHQLELDFAPGELERATQEYQSSGEKIWVQADVRLDDTLVPNVGVRLKGDLSRYGRNQAEAIDSTDVLPALDVVNPATLPWLLRFDEFVDGRRYQTHREIVIRPGGSGITDVTGLNEALTLSLLDAAGLPAERAAYSAVSVDGAMPIVRLVVQNPGASLTADDFERPGALYKALVDGSFAWVDDDPLSYTESFRQITFRNQQDLAPLIEFIDFVANADDESFAAELNQHLDIEAFAAYLAVHNIVADSNDMAGPGQNYFLHWDVTDERFTVISWDMNDTWTADAFLSPYENGAAPAPPGAEPLAPNLLRERFLATPEFQLAYEQTWRNLVAATFTKDGAPSLINAWEAALWQAPVGSLSASTLTAELTELRAAVEERRRAIMSSAWANADESVLPLGPITGW